MGTKFFMSASPEKLREALDRFASTVTVEAEYGSTMVPGSLGSLAHHGPCIGAPAPCEAANGCFGPSEGIEAVGFSHLDLDALGGVLAILGRKPEAPKFWALAAYADVQGYHKAPGFGASPQTLAQFQGFVQGWKSLEKAATQEVADIGDLVIAGEELLLNVLKDSTEAERLSAEYLKSEEALNRASFLELTPEGVVVRASASLRVNHLFFSPTGEKGDTCISLNAGSGVITVSTWEDSQIPLVDIMRRICGANSGGNARFVCSPRGERMTFAQWAEVVTAVRKALHKE